MAKTPDTTEPPHTIKLYQCYCMVIAGTCMCQCLTSTNNTSSAKRSVLFLFSHAARWTDVWDQHRQKQRDRWPQVRPTGCLTAVWCWLTHTYTGKKHAKQSTDSDITYQQLRSRTNKQTQMYMQSDAHIQYIHFISKCPIAADMGTNSTWKEKHCG